MRRHILYVWVLVVVVGCGKAIHDDTVDAKVDHCSTGPMHCAGTTLQRCVDGEYQDDHVCPSACDNTGGCVVCVPGTGTCEGATLSHTCNVTGTGYVDVVCDPVQGMACGAASGVCEGACAPQNIGESYIGCEYYPTVVGNMVSAQYKFAVAVANTTSITATVTIEDGPLATPRVFTVPPNGVHIERLPWVADLKLCMATTWEECATASHTDGALVDRAAYHLRSTSPVSVYQFNPLDYVLTGVAENSYTNDASLLLPTNAWRGEYYAASWGHTATNPSELAVIASQHHTMVTLTTRADTLASGNAPAFKAGVPQTVELDEGSVLEITTRTGDLTGTSIVADKPVQVISGHYAATIPDNMQYADHLEESMFPVATLGTRYLIVAPLTYQLTRMAHYVRVIATQADTTLSYDPPQPGAPTTIAKAGDFVELPDVTASFLINASHKVLVAQYMEGATTHPDNTGDPAMTLTVPVDEFRKSYLVHAPTNYTGNFIDVVAPIDAPIVLDGKPLTTEPIPSTDYAVGRAMLIGNGPGNDGNHLLTSTSPFGISVYGYAPYTSYWYPGGLELLDVK